MQLVIQLIYSMLIIFVSAIYLSAIIFVIPVHQQQMELHMYARLNVMEEVQALDKMQDQDDE